MGVGLFALPAGILGAGFTECYEDLKKMKQQRGRRKSKLARASSGLEQDSAHDDVSTDVDVSLRSLSANQCPFSDADDSSDTEENNFMRASLERMQMLEKTVSELVKASARQEDLLQRLARKLLQ